MTKFRFVPFILVALLCTQTAFAMPLVLRVTKETKVEKEGGPVSVDLIKINTSKYEKVRIGVVLLDRPSGTKGGISVQLYGFEEPKFLFALMPEPVEIYAIRGDFYTNSVLITGPPSAIKLRTNYTGKFEIFVWGK